VIAVAIEFSAQGSDLSGNATLVIGARNRIEANRFALGGRGGVFLYRNCGEDGVIRHQTPSDNVITGNTFTGARWLWPNAVVVGSREGRRRYCAADTGGTRAPDSSGPRAGWLLRRRRRWPLDG
jgi:hypothetical protein